jgi:ketosteroid isomerase-like protein
MPTNRDLITGVFYATSQGDYGPYISAMDDAIQYRVVGSNSWSRLYDGKAAFIAELARPLMSRLQPGGSMRAVRILADGDHVVVEARGANRTQSGEAYENSFCFVIRMGEGRIIEMTEYADTELVTRALGQRA